MAQALQKYEINREIELHKFVCRYYAAGYCHQGDLCIIPHVKDEEKIPDNVCRHFLKKKCHFGKKCLYDHVILIETNGIKNLRIVPSQLAHRIRVSENRQHELSLSAESNLEQKLPPVTENHFKTKSTLKDKSFLCSQTNNNSEVKEHQQNQLCTSCSVANDLEVHRDEHNLFSSLRLPRRNPEVSKTQQRIGFFPSAVKQPVVLQKDEDLKNMNLEKRKMFQNWESKDQNQKYDSSSVQKSHENHLKRLSMNLKHNSCSPNFKTSKLEKLINLEGLDFLSGKCLEKPIDSRHPKETDVASSSRNLIPTQVFKNSIAKDMTKRCDDVGTDQNTARNKSVLNLLCGHDFTLSAHEETQKLLMDLNEKRYHQSNHFQNATSAVYPQGIVLGRKGRKLVSHQIMGNLTKQKKERNNISGEDTYSHDLFSTPYKPSTSNPLNSGKGENSMKVNREGSQSLKDECAEKLNLWSNREDTMTTSASNIPSQGDKILHEDFNFSSQISSPLYLRSPKIPEPARQIPSITKEQTDPKTAKPNVMVTQQSTAPINYNPFWSSEHFSYFTNGK